MGSTGFCRSCGHRNIDRSYSFGRINYSISQRRISASLSRDGSSRMFEDVPSDIIAQVGDSGDQVINDSSHHESSTEALGIGAKQCSFGRISSRGSRRIGSFSLSQEIEGRIPNDVQSQVVARPGDSGYQVVEEDRYKRSGSLGLELGTVQTSENCRNPVPNDASNDLNSCDKNGSYVSTLPSDIVSPLPTDAILYSKDKTSSRSDNLRSSSLKEQQYKLPRLSNYVFYLISLAIFGILGVITRYALQKLFGPGLLALTSNQTLLYLDLPSNMAGSFLMGWLGVVFKGDLCFISDHLAIGLTTGYLGSLTTFSGWNQKMLELSARGQWVFSVAGIILGMFAVNESINIGVESAGWFRGCLSKRLDQSSETTTTTSAGAATYTCGSWRVNNPKRHRIFVAAMLLILALLWGVSGYMFRRKWNHANNGAMLWLGCLVGPPGVWLRWYLARFNGKGLGKKGSLKWLPIGTLAANVLAACIMAALASINNAVNTRRCSIIVSGIQFGFLGCLSTVSTFAAEVYAMRKNGHPGRALAYAAATFVISYALGTLIYSVPVWVKHYH